MGERELRTFTCLIMGFPINSDVRLGEDSLDMEMKFKTPGGMPAYGYTLSVSNAL